MKITAENIDKLTQEAQEDLLKKILDGVHDHDFNNMSDKIPRVKPQLLAAIIDVMDELDGDDEFGTEGWRHSILGED